MNNFVTTLKARLILYNKGKILLLKQTAPNGGNYTLVGGTIEKEEFAKECLIRESKEEAGIILKKEHLELAHILHKRRPHESRITLYFKTKKWQGQLESREPEKFEAVQWFKLTQLPDNLTNTVRHVLLEYQKGKMYSEFFKK